MKLSEIKAGRAYAYNPHTSRLSDSDTVRAVVVKTGITFKCRTYRGEVSYRGVRIRLPDGDTTNVEARRLLATWTGCLEWRREQAAAEKVRSTRRREHAALCTRLQKTLRSLTGVDVVVDTGWSDRGFEIHLAPESVTLSNEDSAKRALSVVQTLEAVA